MTTDSESNAYNLLKEDPELLIKLVDKYVKVNLIKNCSYIGFVHAIDPISHSIILSVPQDKAYQTTIISGHAILDVTETELLTDIKPPQRKQIEVYSKEELTNRKNNLVAWFKTNLLPVEELNDKITVANVSLLPPYSNLDLYTENPIVALQIKKIMEQMPDDFGG